MAKYVGMTIGKGIAVSFLPCSVAFWGFHPYNVLSYFFMCFCYLFLLLWLCGVDERYSCIHICSHS